MNLRNLPSITIMIVTLNNERTLSECLERIVRQNYPKEKIEYLGIDGGSTDNTKKIFKTYGFKVIDSPVKRNAEAQRGIGLSKAKHNLIVSLDADNFIPNNEWIRQMIQPFIDDPSCVHAHTMYYGYRADDSLFNRYVGLFGMADPVVFYVGKPDRLPRYQKKWKLGTIIKETDEYYLVDFTKDTLPTVGCNGVVYRRDVLLNYAKSSPEEFLHIDVFADLIDHGHTRFAIVKNDVIHHTAVTLSRLVEKRLAFLDAYYLSHIERRYLIYDPKKNSDKLKLIRFIVYTITICKPLFDSMRGFLVLPDFAWFVHPLVCWIYLYTYGMASIRRKIS
ncbi:MAG: glycosyltransferase family 2 protein [Patescibacteria group bacterium]|nr:glycosyltransferase family 2 protein [Patescibacteria group bacterium]